MIRAVCFDFDGTLAHFSGDFRALQSRFGLELGLSPGEIEELETLRAQIERQDGPMTFYDTVQAAFGKAGFTQPDNLERLAGETIAEYCTHMKLLPGALEALSLCQSYNLPTALITNGPADMQRAAVRAVGLTNAFEHILVSGDADVAVRKPHPRIFELACGALSSRPAETLMVGDNLEADVRGALQYGMQAVHLAGTLKTLRFSASRALQSRMQAVHLGAGAGPGYETVADVQAFGAWLEAHI